MKIIVRDSYNNRILVNLDNVATAVENSLGDRTQLVTADGTDIELIGKASREFWKKAEETEDQLTLA